MQDTGAPGERLGARLGQTEVLRAVEHEPTGFGPLVDLDLQVAEQTGRVLHLVEDGVGGVFGEKGAWVAGRGFADVESGAAERRRVAGGIRLIDALLAPASPTIVPNARGGFSQQWICGSLLSAFAMMAAQDLTESRQVRDCESCRRLFISQHPASRFCSAPCRWKVQKRKQRERQATSARSRRARKGKAK